MKTLSFEPRRVAIDCLVLLVLHAVALQIMAHTRLIEKVMASQFSAGEFMAILAFIGLRLAVYSLVPGTLAALFVWEITRRLGSRSKS